jgi:hypothetical protein
MFFMLFYAFFFYFSDALVDPKTQRIQYPSQLFANSIIDEYETIQMETINEKCIRDIKAQKWSEASDSCDLIAKFMNIKSSDVNIYDLRKFGIPFNRSALINYVQQPSFYDSIFLNSSDSQRLWVECNSKVKLYLKDDLMQSVLPLVDQIISDERIKVLFYNGQFDVKDGPLGFFFLFIILLLW